MPAGSSARTGDEDRADGEWLGEGGATIGAELDATGGDAAGLAGSLLAGVTLAEAVDGGPAAC
jgi:hypothetical protein